MTATITIGWWVVPAILSLLAVIWCSNQNYSGDYNFTAVYTFPVTGMAICFVWAVYFAVMLAFS